MNSFVTKHKIPRECLCLVYIYWLGLWIDEMIEWMKARSGMGVDENCKKVFMELQRKKAHPYIVFKIDERKKQVVVDKIGEKGDTYDEFVASLPEAECRYAVYDFDFITHDNCNKSKIFFVSLWVISLVPTKLCLICIIGFLSSFGREEQSE